MESLIKNFFRLEIESELKQLKINKVYLFDPQESLTTKLSNGTESEVSSFETVQLYEKFESCSTKPPKTLPYNLKRI